MEVRSMLAATCVFGLACAAPDSTQLDALSEADELGFCGVGDPTTALDAPEFAGFVDELEHDAYCAEHPGHAVCSKEFGTLRQAWTSAEFHGGGGNSGPDVPCYGARLGGAECRFPASKSFRINARGNNCDASIQTAKNNQTQGATASQLAAIQAGFFSGISRWNGLGGATVSLTPGTGTQVFVDCLDPNDLSGAIGTTDNGTTTVRVSDLPVGPHGGNPGAASTYGSAIVRFGYSQIWAGALSLNAISNQQLTQYARNVGTHEMAHALGFGHFSTGFMARKSSNFSSDFVIPQSFIDAFNAYNPGGSGVHIVDTGLQSSNPE